MDPYDAVKSLLGKHRFSNLDNHMLTKAILKTIKDSEEIDRQGCGHDVSYFDGTCVVCRTKEMAQ